MANDVMKPRTMLFHRGSPSALRSPETLSMTTGKLRGIGRLAETNREQVVRLDSVF